MNDTFGPLIIDSYRHGRERGAIDCRYNRAEHGDNPFDAELQPPSYRRWIDGWTWVSGRRHDR